MPLLHELPDDSLREIFARVELPYVLKLVCRALRAAAPKQTRTTMKVAAQSIKSLRVAKAMLFPFPWDERFTVVIAERGELEVLKWAHDVLRMPLNKAVSYTAATTGSLEMVQWFTGPETDCPIDSCQMAEAAAAYGHFHILEHLWAYSQYMNARVTSSAAGWGDLKTFQWLLDRKVGVTQMAFACAARGSGLRKLGEHKAIMDLMLSRGMVWGDETFPNSVQTAALDTLKYMRRRGCHDRYPQLTMMYAAEANRRDVLEWLRNDEPGYALDERVAWAAARAGHLKLLKWLRAEGCPWDHATVRGCANVQRFDVFRWVAANGGHIYHRQVNLGMLRRDLLSSPTGPLIDQLVPEAAWVHALMRWRRVKLWFAKFCIARYWERLV